MDMASVYETGDSGSSPSCVFGSVIVIEFETPSGTFCHRLAFEPHQSGCNADDESTKLSTQSIIASK